MNAVDPRFILAALFGGGARMHAEMTAADAAIRGIQPVTRRVGVLSVDRGAGTSTLAHQLTGILAARRGAPLLAIDVSAGRDGLAARLGAAPVDPDPTRADARTTAQALSGLTVTGGVVALRPRHIDDPVTTWLAAAAPITRFFEVSITDFGARDPSGDLAACAAVCDTLCLVSDARRSLAERARSVAPAIAALPEEPSVILALIDRDRRGEAVARALSARSAHPVVAVPHDGGLRRGTGPARALTHRRLLSLTAGLLRTEERAS